MSKKFGITYEKKGTLRLELVSSDRTPPGTIHGEVVNGSSSPDGRDVGLSYIRGTHISLERIEQVAI